MHYRLRVVNDSTVNNNIWVRISFKIFPTQKKTSQDWRLLYSLLDAVWCGRLLSIFHRNVLFPSLVLRILFPIKKKQYGSPKRRSPSKNINSHQNYSYLHWRIRYETAWYIYIPAEVGILLVLRYTYLFFPSLNFRLNEFPPSLHSPPSPTIGLPN